jgi:signal transduction histidine kinase
VKRDHEFLEDASHRLRTPVTGLRLELEELGLRRDLDPEVRDTVERSVATLDHLDELTTGIFAMARAGRGAAEERQVALEDLARQTAQSWAMDLADKRMDLSSSVDGDLTLSVTPGPVEQVLELVLADLLRSARGKVTLAFHGSTERLTLQVAAEPQPDLGARGPGPELVQQMVDALAGRCSGDVLSGGLRVWLPRR